MKDSMRNFRLPFKQWSSGSGRKILDRLIRGEASLPNVEAELRLPFWEVILIERAVWRFKKRRGSSVSAPQRSRAVRDLADELDVFRTGNSPSNELLEGLESDSFKGK